VSNNLYYWQDPAVCVHPTSRGWLSTFLRSAVQRLPMGWLHGWKVKAHSKLVATYPYHCVPTRQSS